MPSPLSIVIRVAAVVASCVQSLQVYSDVTVHFDALSVSEISTKTEFDSVATLLQRIVEVLNSRPRLAAQWASSENLAGKALQSTMENCELIFSVLTEELYGFTNKSLGMCQPWSTKAQFVQLWNASGVKIALQHMSALIAALDLLHSLLIIEGKAEMMDILTDEQSRETFAKLARSARRLRAKRDGVLGRPESNPLPLATAVPTNVGFDLDSYFVDSEPYRRAWMLAKSKSSSNDITQPNYRQHEPTDLARTTAPFQAVRQQRDQLSFRGSEVREVSKMDPRISVHDHGAARVIEWLSQSDSPPPPYTQTPNKIQRNITSRTTDLQVPDMFSLLDHPQIAQAVLNANCLSDIECNRLRQRVSQLTRKILF